MGLQEEHMKIEDSAMTSLIQGYCREAGVRNLQKHVEKICRKVALKVVRTTGWGGGKPAEAEVTEAKAAEADDSGLSMDAELRDAWGFKAAAAESKPPSEPPAAAADTPAEADTPEPFDTIVIGADELSDYVGKPTFTSERLYDVPPAGVVTGLAWTSMGGAVLYIETQPVGTRHISRMSNRTIGSEGEGGDDAAGSKGGGGASVTRTGQLGDVMKESSVIAHTFARTYLAGLDADNTFLEEAHVHLHVPEGATPKDGPSAGVTMVTSLLSLAMDRPARADLAMTGELSLTGRVLPIGGVKEKTIAARRAGVRHIVFPKQNERDYAELPDILKEGVTPHFAHTYDDVYRVAFGTDDELAALAAAKKESDATPAA